MDVNQLRELIARVLRYLDPEIPYSEDAVELLLMTAAHESRLGTYLKQLRGPARGIFQMEPQTEAGLLEALSARAPSLRAKIAALNLPLDGQDGTTSDQDMLHNLAYQVAMARAHYYLKPGRIPHGRREMAEYAKRWWNTRAGKASANDYLAAYRDLVERRI